MLRYFTKFKLKSGFLFGMIFLEVSINIFAITQINNIISSLLQKDISQFIYISVINILLWIGYILINTTKNIYQEYLVQKLILHVKQDISYYLSSMQIDEYCDKSYNEYISWFNQDCEKIMTGFNAILIAIRYILFILITMISLAFIHYQLIIFIVINLILILGIPQFLQKMLQAQTIFVSSKTEEYVNKVSILLKGYKILFFSDALSIFNQKIFDYSKNLSKSKFDLEVKTQFVSVVVQVLSITSQIGLILFSGYLVLHNQIEFGHILVISNLAGQLFHYVSTLSSLVAKIQSIKPILKKLNLYNDPVQKIYYNDSIVDSIVLNNINYEVKNKHILKNISFKIKQGRKYLIVGESGSGKSTFLKILCGIIKKYDGFITIDGHEDISKFSKNFDYLEENTVLFDMSLKENITFNQEIENYQHILKVVNIDEKLKDLNNLSLGEKQRIGIAQVLCKNKNVMCFDESFSNLDSDNLQRILQYILNLDKTVIIISHHLSKNNEIKKMFDAIIEFKDGEIVNSVI